jgi:uncharacterized phage protein (TIGR01671 family)
MRKIKFRAWNGTWMDNDFFIHSDGTAYDRAARTYDTPNTEIETVGGMIIMQFTGLRDIQENDIYEGDIVQQCAGHSDSLKYQIGWRMDRCGFWLYIDAAHPHLDLSTALSNLEIIGNVYEHPAMLNNH